MVPPPGKVKDATCVFKVVGSPVISMTFETLSLVRKKPGNEGLLTFRYNEENFMITKNVFHLPRKKVVWNFSQISTKFEKLKEADGLIMKISLKVIIIPESLLLKPPAQFPWLRFSTKPHNFSKCI